MRTLVIGAGRGIGLSLALKLSKSRHVVYSYKLSQPLISDAIGLYLDLSNESSIFNFLSSLSSESFKFKTVYLCAAIPGIKSIDNSFLKHSLNFSILHEYMSINCYSYIKIISGLVERSLVFEDTRILALSSLAGSTTLRGRLIHNIPGGDLAYRLSKSALNCAIKNIAYDLSSVYPNISIVSVHPGWVRTESGGSDAWSSVDDVVDRLINLEKTIKPAQSGEFMTSDGMILQP